MAKFNPPWFVLPQHAGMRNLQQSVEDAARRAQSIPISDGALLSETFAGAGTKRIAHNLSRPIQGAIVVSSTDPTVRISPQCEGGALDYSLHFNANVSGACTVRFWVF